MTDEFRPGSFFGDIPDLARADLIARGERRRYAAGRVLFRQSEQNDAVVFVLTGRVKVSSFAPDGSEVVLGLCGPGDVLGELSVLDGQPRSATVTASEDVEGLVVAARDFDEVVHTHPEVAVRVLQRIIGHLRESDRVRIEFGTLDTAARVASRLVALAAEYGEVGDHGLEVSLPLTQEELASWVGASREAVARALRQLRERGAIETGRKHVTIVDLPALERRAR